MSHYETLGVERDAGAAEIKRAYRRASRGAHPDVGGSDDAMARVNAAYEVLGDAQRRARYDETGEDQAPPAPELAARNVLLQVLSQAIDTDAPDPVSWAGDVLRENLARACTQGHGAERRIATLEKKRKQVKVREGENLIHGLIDQQLEKLHTSLLEIAAFEVAVKRAMELLERHEFVVPARSAAAAPTADLLFKKETTFATEVNGASFRPIRSYTPRTS